MRDKRALRGEVGMLMYEGVGEEVERKGENGGKAKRGEERVVSKRVASPVRRE
jgi:hypothetical protein